MDVDGDDGWREPRGQAPKETVHQLPLLVGRARTEHLASDSPIGIGPVDPSGVLQVRDIASTITRGKCLQLPRPRLPQKAAMKVGPEVLGYLKANYPETLFLAASNLIAIQT